VKVVPEADRPVTQSPGVPAPSPAAAGTGLGRFAVPGLVATLAAGLVLRFFTTSDLWLDEALTVNIAELPLDQLHEALRQDGAPPLYYVLLHGWINLFGSGDLAARSLSGIASIATLPLIWFAGRRLGGRTVGWSAVALLASSPFAVRYATEARMYALQMLLVVGGYLALVRAFESPRLPRLALVAAITGALLYLQYWSLYLVAVVGAVLVFRSWRSSTLLQRQASRSVLVAVVAGCITFLPWVPTFLYQSVHTGTPWGGRVFPSSAFIMALVDFAGGAYSDGYTLLLPLLLLAVLGVFGRATGAGRIELDLRTRPRARWEAFVFLAALLLGMAAAYVGGTTFQGRYAAFVFPLFVLLAACGVAVFADRRVRAAVLVVIVGLGLVGSARTALRNRTQAEEVADVITAEARPGDVVGYCPDQVAPDASRLIGDEPGLEHLTYPRAEGPELIDWVDYQERVDAADPAAFAALLLERADPDGTVWLVSSPGYRNFDNGQCEAIVAALGAERPGAVRSRPESIFFESMGLSEYPPP